MMIHAYQETYLNRVQSMIGDAFDYAVNICSITGKEFIKLFVGSTVSNRLERGEPAYLVGKSGIELVIDIVNETKGIEIEIEPQERYGRSREYWIGWAIAYYQWVSDRKYSEIFEAVSYEDLEIMYDTLHEADVTKFSDIIDARIKAYYPDTKLKHIRKLFGLTQAQLAKSAGVSLRSIQMYEQRNKDINKASVETIYKLAKVLGCSIEDLLEK